MTRQGVVRFFFPMPSEMQACIDMIVITRTILIAHRALRRLRLIDSKSINANHA